MSELINTSQNQFQFRILKGQNSFDGFKSQKPFLKWAGGKSQLISSLFPLVPINFSKYIEPFIGGGALFFAINHHRSIISDSNEELIITYKMVRDNVSNLN
ncbi:MAG: DNA adenine methylase [Pyrinomonadaceae bacterium]|nr:DNA adenine methylase [Pyrinomonadaceae bacterium]